jgi:hypothetical protein
MKIPLQISLFILLFYSCNNRTPDPRINQSTDTADQAGRTMHSMKGFELYIWKEDSLLRFNLMTGTNRLKTGSEIRNPEKAVTGITEIKKKLEGIRPGEYLSLRLINVDSVEVKPLQDYLHTRGLNVSMTTQAPPAREN